METVDLRQYENELYKKGINNIGGVDEVGRGPLIGPVVAACVVLPKDFVLDGLTDSKKLSEKKRNEFYNVIMNKAIAIGIGIVDEKTILAQEKSHTKQHMAKSNTEIDPFESKKDRKHESITSTGINFVNGKVVATPELDKAMLDNFGKCPSMHYFAEEYDNLDAF